MIRDIILTQKRELKKRLKEKYVDRGFNLKLFKDNLIKVIIGPRRSGKSFFAIHTLNKLGNFGYVNFDDERLIDIEDYDDIISNINSIYANPKYLLFDEIQNLDKWELFVNRIQRQGYNVVITGSNSNLLSKELATHLTGRYRSIIMFPFSFKEFLDFENKQLTSSEKKVKLREHIIKGGYPEPLVKNLDYKDYLSTLFNSIIYKDIVKRFNIRSVQGIEDLALYLISHASQEFSYNTLANVTKCKSVHTVEKYLGFLEEAFIFFRLNRFSYKLKEQIMFNKKIYCIDSGMISSKAFKTSQNIGRMYEDVVAIKLKKEEMKGNLKVYYWKNPQQEEVDFVIKRNLKVEKLIQLCFDISDIKTKEREIRSLIKASKELKCNDLVIITDDKSGEEKSKWVGIERKIKFIPLWKWLLE